jgi:ATP-dependent exoDNAse (exonuclease V) beta subunit
LLERDKQFAEQERRRMYYVAATRARDLLVLPAPLTKSKTLHYATAELANDADSTLVERFETFELQQLPLWSRIAAVPASRQIVADQELQDCMDAVQQTFATAVHAATRPIAAPAAVTAQAASAAAEEELDLQAEHLRKAERSRFGPTFGSVVHRALELLVARCVDQVETAVSLAAQEASLTEASLSEHRADAEADVRRALDTLRHLGVLGNAAVSVASEYPLAMQWGDGQLLSGYLDLVAIGAEQVTVIDYKTDAPRRGALRTAYPEYAAQLRLYGELLRAAGVVGARALKLGVLLTASGELRWL